MPGLGLVSSCALHPYSKDKIDAASVRAHFFLKPLPSLLEAIKEINILRINPNLVLLFDN